MSDLVIGPTEIETEADLDPGERGTWQLWMARERIQDKEEAQWRKRAYSVVKRYRDERPDSLANMHRFNILWSNVQTLLPTLYARTPKPDVQRRFKDQDDTGRLASLLLERSLTYSLQQPSSGFDAVMKHCVLDRLLPGRGVARVLYVPHFGDEIPPEEAVGEEFDEEDAADVTVGGPGDQGDTGPPPDDLQGASEPVREVVYEEVLPRYVYWEDYREGAARTWEEVPWLRYRAYMTRDELIKRFGKKLGSQVKLDYPKPPKSKGDSKEEPPPDLYKKAIVHEYWDRANGRVIWLPPGTEDLVLDEIDDPLGLPDFYPSVDPLSATMTTDKRVPVPDYIEYQDQANELDKLTMRIDTLTRALKVCGIYPGEQKQALQQLFDPGTENRLMPVLDWVPFAEKGGLANFIQYLPIKEIADVLIRLYDARDRVKQILYEITGIGDILRGETEPMETATAQQLKSNFATRRIVPQQREVARFARDIIRLMGAIISEHFSAQTISQITGYPQLLPVPELPPAPPMWLPAPQQAPQVPANDQGPPPDALHEGVVTHFANGQKWARHQGQPVRVA